MADEDHYRGPERRAPDPLLQSIADDVGEMKEHVTEMRVVLIGNGNVRDSVVFKQEQQADQIAYLKKARENQKKWTSGILASVVVAVILAVLAVAF